MSLTVQWQTMAAMMAMGVWLGASLDTYHRLAKVRPRFRWFAVVCDFLFWVVQGLAVFYVLLLVNEGEMRFYIVLALLLGFSFYKALLEKPFLRFLEFIIKISLFVYRFCRRFVQIFFIIPIRWLLKLVSSLCMMIVTVSYKTVIFLFSPLKRFVTNRILKRIKNVFKRGRKGE